MMEKKSSQDKFGKPYRFECTQCGRCCRDKSTMVNLTYVDILRLAKALNQDYDKLIDSIGFYIFQEGVSDENLDKMVIPPIETQRGLAFVALRKEADGACIFLKNDNTCSIYEHRPNICRTFPFHFDAKAKNQPQNEIKITMSYTEKAKQYCLGVGVPNPVVDAEKWMKIGRKTVRNIVEEAAIIEKWNKAVESGKITPKAENYIKNIIRSKLRPGKRQKLKQNQKRKTPRKNTKRSSVSINANRKETKKSWKQIAQEKLNKEKGQKNKK